MEIGIETNDSGENGNESVSNSERNVNKMRERERKRKKAAFRDYPENAKQNKQISKSLIASISYTTLHIIYTRLDVNMRLAHSNVMVCNIIYVYEYIPLY